jgi:ankyrin repeat protein
LAAVNSSLECVRLLLDGGASMMVRTVDLDVVSDVAAPAGSTPLHVAAMTGHVAILQAMLQVLVEQVCSKRAVP